MLRRRIPAGGTGTAELSPGQTLSAGRVCAYVMEAPESLRALIGGHRSTALIYVAAKLRLADLLAQKPASSHELAEQLQVKTDALHRILRGLVVVGLIREANGTFALTTIGECLRTDVAGSLYEYAILAGENIRRRGRRCFAVCGSGMPFEKFSA